MIKTSNPILVIAWANDFNLALKYTKSELIPQLFRTRQVHSSSKLVLYIFFTASSFREISQRMVCLKLGLIEY